MAAFGLLWALLILPASAQTITLNSSPGVFYGDDKSGAGLVNNYAFYSISNNTGVAIPSVYVVITNMVATNRIKLSPNDPGVVNLESLAPGEVKLAGFYLQGPSLGGGGDSLTGLTNEVHTIQVLNAPPGLGSVLASQTFGFSNITYVTEASANKVVLITNLNPKAVLGSIVPLVIAGHTGTVGSPPIVIFSPAVFNDWRPDAYQLQNSFVQFDQNPSYSNRLYFDGGTVGFTNFTDNNYTNTYYFRATKVTGTNVPVSPYGFIASGNIIKHTALSSLSALGPTNSAIVSVTNAVTINHTVTPTNFLAAFGAMVTYTIVISNTSTANIALDQIVDTLPSFPDNATFVPNSTTFNSAAWTNPAVVGQTLVWSQPMLIPPNGTSVLSFQAYAPYPGGRYTNSVVGIIGNDTIGTILDTGTNNPSLSVFNVIPVADIGVSKSGLATVYASTNFDYTITVTNAGPSPTVGLCVTDAVPAGLTYVGSTPPAILSGSVLIWTNLNPVWGGKTTNLTVTFHSGTVNATYVNSASGGNTAIDFNPTNNSSASVFTTNIPWADVAIFKNGPATNVLPNANFNYTILVTNYGPSLATSVTVTDSLPAGLAFVSASGGGVLNGGQVVWNLGNLPTGTGTTLTVTVISPAHGTLTNTATAISTLLDLNGSNNATPPVTTTVANLVPVVANDFANTLPNTPVLIPVLANDSDGNGDLLTIVSVTQTNGTAVISGPNVMFTPALNFIGNLVLTYTVTDGFGGTNSASIFITVSSLSDLAITKAAPGIVNSGGPLNYTISVTNNGPATATNVVVTDPLPSGATFVSADSNGTNNGGVVTWNLGDFAKGQVTNLTLVVTTPAGGTLTNIASVASDTGDLNSSNNVTPPVATLVTQTADLGIGKSAATEVFAGDNLTYTITVTNFGPNTASNVVVTDPLPAGVSLVSASGGGVNNSGTVTWSLGDLANGAVSSVTLTVLAPSGGTLTNSAGVGSSSADPNTTNNVTPQVITDVTTLADLGIGKVAAASINAGENLTYTISVTNFGPTVASSVVVTDALPAGVTFVSASSGGVNNSGIVTWTLGDLPNGAVTNVTVTVTAPASGSLTNMAVIGAPTSDPNSTNNSTPPVVTSVTPQADLVISLAGPTNIQSATDFNYIINITNLGPSDAAGVVVTDTLPAGLTFVSASDGGTNDNGTVIWSLASLTNGQSFSLTLTVTAPLNGTVTNAAGINSLTGDPDLTNNVTASLTTDVLDLADLGIGKSGPAESTYGSNFDYTISVTNFGPATATGIIVTDSLPAGLAFVSANPPATVNGANQVIWTNLGSLASGATTNLTLTVSPLSSGAVNNTASVGSDEPDPIATNNTTPPVATTVKQGAAVVTWPTPGSIVYGTPLDTNQANATASVPGTFVYAPPSGTVLPAGTNVLSVLFTPSDTNYAATNVSVSLSVLPATLTVTANSSNRLYGAANPAFTASYGGFVNGDTSSVLSGSPSLTTVATASSPAGSYPITATAGTLSASNYVFSFVNGTLTVNQATLTVTANNTNRVYGAANPTFTASYSGFVNGDSSSVLNGSPSLTTLAASTSATGNYAITAAAGTLSASNYLFSFVNGTLAVGQAALTVTANNQIKIYGMTLTLGPGQTAFTSSGLKNGESIGSVTLTASGGTNASAPAGTYTITPSAATGGTFAATNYLIAYANGSLVVTQMVAADIAVLLTGATTAVQSSNFIYTITVTNLGPSAASNVVASDSLPAGMTFMSASSGGKVTNGVVTWPKITSLAVGAKTNYTLTVNAPLTGLFTNLASASATTYDPNPTNNSGVAFVTEVDISPFGFLAGSPVLNPQTGLYEESVTVTNNAGISILGFRLYVGGLTSNVTLYNASGITNGVPFVNYHAAVAGSNASPANTASLILQFYNPTRLPFTNTLWAESIVLSSNNVVVSTNGSLAISRIFQDTRTNGVSISTRFVIEFASVPGKTYTILYRSDMGTWKVATPSVTASGTVTQWYDDGPPETESKPSSVTSRCYRVFQY